MLKEAGSGVTTPGSSSESWPVLRPFRGSELTVVPEMTSPTVGDSVWSRGGSAVTSTVSSSEPTASWKSSRATCLASIVIGGVSADLKPWSSALTR